ncbi:MAG: D-glycerate dehydrogenase [Deltaproteobacteria bacterium]|nr:D-glycerate dehydrogenase [Deltaproteobacteria bacterium]
MKVLVTARMPEEVLAQIRREHEVESYTEDPPIDRQSLLRLLPDREGLLCTITDAIDEELLDRGPNLRVIANYGVGFEHIDVAAATRRGIPVTNTPGVLTDATADLAFALVLATARRLVEGDKRVRDGKFTYWSPLLFLGVEVSGKTLGIIGLGRIGRAMAQRARGFGMRVLYFSRTPLPPDEEQELSASFAPLENLLAEADFVSLHVPLTPETRHLIGRRELALMKPTARLINTARGPVVDEGALVEALRQGRLGGAGLDVYEQEPQLTPGLTDLDNVVLLPHMGSATIETRTKMGLMAAANLLAGLKGERPPNCLNWTELQDKNKGGAA